LRVIPSLSVSTIETASERLGYKRVIAKAGSTAVLIAFSYKLQQARESDFFTLGANEQWKFEAPKGKKIWYVFYKTSSGTSTLELIATDGDLDKIV
jgi:hypothetical protein